MLNQIKIMDIEIPNVNPNEKNDECFNMVPPLKADGTRPQFMSGGPKREDVIKYGLAYPAVVIAEYDSIYQISFGRGYTNQIGYSVDIKFMDNEGNIRIFSVKNLSNNSLSFVLDNPYCTVYDYQGVYVASDFKSFTKIK